VAGPAGLTGRNSRCDHDIAELAGLPDGKGQHIRDSVFSPVTKV